MEHLIGGIFGGIFLAFLTEFVILALLRTICFYTIVPEGACYVYVLWGKVVCVLREPGLYLLWTHLTWRGPIFRFVGGTVYKLDMRLDQKYLRSQAVNSEEGAPMGIGVWYEMFISDPTAFLFQNADPVGSLVANVSSATVRTLSNMPLAQMLENRHAMSLAVRNEVSGKSHEWGYKLGSVYIRKVHFRDTEMIKQIEDKVVNRLRQVTAAIRQDGENRVNIIASNAQRTSAAEFARAAAMRPQIVGKALQDISRDPETAQALFTVLETQRMLSADAKITLLPKGSGMLAPLLASQAAGQPGAK